MPWNFDSDKPIFVQLVERLESDIVSGKYSPGEKLPTVRELAVEAAVNPNTMQKAYGELERLGLVYTQRTSGRFVTEDSKLIDRTRKTLAEKNVREFLAGMKEIGIDRDEAVRMLTGGNK
ncbi:MAG: GntR family transcriptional regulator [Lachnospiraceae bacterium]|nr:GntR family transcriptional regulator [Lachnospiraceae bacterium]